MFARKIATQTSRKATNSSTPSDTRSAAIVRACPLDKASKVARQTSVSRQHNSYTRYVPLQPATGQVHLHSVHACKTKENPWHPPCGRWSQHVKYESTQQLTFFSVEHLETSSKVQRSSRRSRLCWWPLHLGYSATLAEEELGLCCCHPSLGMLAAIVHHDVPLLEESAFTVFRQGNILLSQQKE